MRRLLLLLPILLVFSATLVSSQSASPTSNAAHHSTDSNDVQKPTLSDDFAKAALKALLAIERTLGKPSLEDGSITVPRGPQELIDNADAEASTDDEKAVVVALNHFYIGRLTNNLQRELLKPPSYNEQSQLKAEAELEKNPRNIEMNSREAACSSLLDEMLRARKFTNKPSVCDSVSSTTVNPPTVSSPTANLQPATLGAQTADEIIGKSITARGGISKIMAIQTRRLTGDIEISSPDVGALSASFVELEARPSKLRRDLSIQGINVTLTQGYDGQNGWKTTPAPGKSVAEPMTGDELKEFQEESDMDGSLVNYRQKGHTAELVGKEKVDGVDAYNIKLTLKSGGQRNLYIDTTSFLEIKVISQVAREGGPVEIQTILSDYRVVEGIQYPFVIESKIPSQQVNSKVTLEKIETNVPIDNSVFKAPAPEAKPAPATKPK